MSERVHHLKCHPEFFGDVVAGIKTFEVRKDDRGFTEGDELMLYQWPQPDVAPHAFDQVRYRLPKFLVRVTYILRGGDWGIERGYVVMGIEAVDTGWRNR